MLNMQFKSRQAYPNKYMYVYDNNTLQTNTIRMQHANLERTPAVFSMELYTCTRCVAHAFGRMFDGCVV